jgi:hypothetical protein
MPHLLLWEGTSHCCILTPLGIPPPIGTLWVAKREMHASCKAFEATITLGLHKVIFENGGGLIFYKIDALLHPSYFFWQLKL